MEYWEIDREGNVFVHNDIVNWLVNNTNNADVFEKILELGLELDPEYIKTMTLKVRKQKLKKLKLL